ncbi:hypothetical protein L204_105073 [Cryptococcus depauperatus]|nr:hypothetical protein L204_03722 [Cryptococcus depauperatus CBS 7855]
MSCEQIPSVTLYGTTQITTTSSFITTLTSIIPGNPVISTSTSVEPGKCDGNANCPSQTKSTVVTVTPSETSTYTSATQTNVVVTSVVPQKTLYYPCSPVQHEAGQAAQINTSQESSSSTATDDTASSQSSSSMTDGGLKGQPSKIASQSTTQATSGNSQSLPVSPFPSMPTGAGSLSPSGSSRGSTTSDHSGAASSTTSSDASHKGTSSSSNNSAALAGGIVGGILGIILLVCLIICLRRKATRKNQRRQEGGGLDQDYWERHFRALEAEGDNDMEKDDWDLKSSRKLHLTLDLASKNTDLDLQRPPSMLSTISSFVTSLGGAVPTRISEKSGLNFSRPLKRPPLPSETDTTSVRSYPKSPKSVKTNGSKRISVVSRRSGKSQRMSASVLPSMMEEDEGSEGNENRRQQGMDEPKIVEWIRHSQTDSVEESNGFQNTGRNKRSSAQMDRLSGLSYQSGKTLVIGPPPPKRPPTAYTFEKTSSIASTYSSHSTFGSYSNHSAAISPYESLVSTGNAPYPFPLGRMPIYTPLSYGVTRSHSNTKFSSPYLADDYFDEGNRQSFRKAVPPLHLSQAATTPSLWVDDDLLARFEDAESNEGNGAHGHGGLASVFSAPTTTTDDGSSSPKTPYNETAEDNDVPSGSSMDKGKPRGLPVTAPSSDTSVSPKQNISRTSPWSTSSAASSMEDTTQARIGTAERSAVTPQLPILALGSSVIGSWGIGLIEEGEKMNTTGK